MSEPLVSTLGGDPDLAELVDEYVAALAGRMQEIEAALAAGDRRRVEVLAHQIVGSAGMHGFQTLGQAARQVEEAAAGGNAEVIAAAIRELGALAARARAR